MPSVEGETNSTKPKLVYNTGSIERKVKRVLVTGGAGFLGSHLVDRLMESGCDVICLDNLFSGCKTNISKWIGHERFEFIRHDVIKPLTIEVDEIYHLACPASPVFYQNNPIKTIKTSFMGTLNMLGLAKRCRARILLTSTSEVYGDPLEHPQRETYWGYVNPIGIRSCYNEGKRIAETLMFEYNRQNDVDIRVARIFNTYGPRMLENDGCVVSNFIVQALKGKSITVYGEGSQTRSFCYCSDQIDGIIKLMAGNHIGPVNIGNPNDYTILQLAETIRKLVNPDVEIVFKPLPSDDPRKRRPDISRAKNLLGWSPTIGLEEGLGATVRYFRKLIEGQDQSCTTNIIRKEE